MTTPAEGVVKLKATTVQTPRRSRHRSRRRKKIAARILLALGLLMGVLAISDFAYNAYRRTDCLTGAEFDESGIRIPAPTPSDECITELADRDDRLRLDATIAAVAAAFLIGSIAISRKIKTHRR